MVDLTAKGHLLTDPLFKKVSLSHQLSGEEKTLTTSAQSWINIFRLFSWRGGTRRVLTKLSALFRGLTSISNLFSLQEVLKKSHLIFFKQEGGGIYLLFLNIRCYSNIIWSFFRGFYQNGTNFCGILGVSGKSSDPLYKKGKVLLRRFLTELFAQNLTLNRILIRVQDIRTSKRVYEWVWRNHNRFWMIADKKP